MTGAARSCKSSRMPIGCAMAMQYRIGEIDEEQGVIVISKIAALALALCLSACAIGNEYNYNSAAPALEAEGSTSVIVAVSDQRPYVLSGGKSASFVGLQRGGYGNPFNVTTTGGQPFADQLSNAIAKALSARGYGASPTFIPPGTAAEDVAFSSDRLLFVAMREWKSDSSLSITMHHDADAIVYKPGHRDPASASIKSTGPGGAAQISPSATAKIAISASSRAIAELLNQPQIRDALN